MFVKHPGYVLGFVKKTRIICKRKRVFYGSRHSLRSSRLSRKYLAPILKKAWLGFT